ncbi:MAG: ATP-binding protein [Desulfofustis sp.]
MSRRDDTGKDLGNAEREIVYLKRIVARMEKRLLRQEKLDDMNRHQTQWAMHQLEQARKQAEEANQAKTDFLANMSHEIRSPLNIVLGMGELLAGTRLDENQRHYLQSLQLSGEHLLKLINDILDFSRIESGTVTVVSESFDLAQLLAEVEAMGAHLASEKGLRFELINLGNLEPNRQGDSRKIKQVLINLIGNAIKYTDRGMVTLAVDNSEEDKSGRLLFSVTDTGIGIPAEQREQIFERFTQADHGFMRSTGGVGLGLAISHRLVAAMGGQIDIDSEVGVGSTFTVQLGLPLSEHLPVQVWTGQGRTGTEASLPQLHVLVVEDIYLNFELIINYLQELPITFDYAADGRQALKIFLDNAYDAVLMDLRMPVMGGVEAVKHIRALERQLELEPTPVIVMTAHAFIEQEKDYLESGFDAVLIKPFKKIDLVRSLKQVISDSGAVEHSSTSGLHHDSGPGPSGSLTSLVPQVLESFSEEIKQIKKELQQHDRESLQSTCHALKGLAGLYGFGQFANLVEHLEESVSRREYRTANALADALNCHVNELRERNVEMI